MKLFLSLTIAISGATVFADENTANQRILENPVVQGFIAAQEANNCRIYEEQGTPVMWMCTGAVIEESERQFLALQQTKINIENSCGIAIIFDCGSSYVTLYGQAMTLQILGADNTPYGAPYSSLTFDDIIVQPKQ